MGNPMQFREFIEITDYSATHIAHCLLYRPNSRPAKLAKNFNYKPTECDFFLMRKLIAGRETLDNLFPPEEYKKAS